MVADAFAHEGIFWQKAKKYRSQTMLRLLVAYQAMVLSMLPVIIPIDPCSSSPALAATAGPGSGGMHKAAACLITFGAEHLHTELCFRKTIKLRSR